MINSSHKASFVLRGLLVLLLVGVVSASLAEAKIGEGLTPKEDEPLHIVAETLEYLADENLFVAEGAVEITYGATRLTADRVEFNEVTGDAVAIGNVYYEEGGETITADQGEFNFDDELGVITMGSIALEDDQYITGEQIFKTGEETYRIRKGTFTACDSSRPAWQFRSTTAKVHQGEYLQAWNTVGFIKGIPVFYFPYFIFPIKTERQTGLLVPDIGRSTINGYTVSNAFFWAITDSQDATVRHTFYEERGHKVDLEYRYKYSEQTDGTFEGQYIRDRLDLSEKKRLKWNHRHGLPYEIKARVNLDLTSDDQFDEDFSTRLDERSDRKLDSDISLTRNFSQHSVRLLFDRLDDLREESDDRSDQRFPELSITSQKQQVFGTPLYIQQETQISRLRREGKDEQRLEFERIDIQPTLSLPLNIIGQALTINPELQLRETYYTRDAETAADPDLDAEAVHREYYTAIMRVYGPKFNRIFDFGTSHRTQKLKHLIEPNLTFQYRPGIDEEEYPKFDGVDRVGSEDRSRTLSYGITQRLLTKRVKQRDWDKFHNDEEEEEEEEPLTIEDLATETKELASLTINQSYNFERDEYNFSNINATLKTEPFDNYEFSLRTTYDIYVNAFVTTDIDLSGDLWDTLNFSARWRRNLSVDRDTDDITDVNQFLDIDTHLSLFNTVGLSYRGRFNIEENERIEDNIGLTYNAQCWNFTGTYTQQLIGDERDKAFHLLIELKHLGKLLDLRG
ncbi:LPS assembly protein LptD [candidate division KSB3 bacterium]|uniref:LPS assembly protein LptD n=1 Tax=candidate division KSB3 bacterium TaxID=2044937 RepID=A0A9D5K062_9BACT|nr:LPS assembly protein LptD [candidate division KSB3 bacterium]MBD3327370.1 LPS assembly protein LptD [candidate division KSB3 bacterium]